MNVLEGKLVAEGMKIGIGLILILILFVHVLMNLSHPNFSAVPWMHL